MIRKFKESDLPRIMQIWLSANKEAHGFIKESYWDENFEAVKTARNMGIGKELLDFAKINHMRLTLNVYIKNSGAVMFYRRELFSIDSRGIDEETGEEDYMMSWNRK